MTQSVKQREINIPEDFSDYRDKIRVMLVSELLRWLRNAEDAEEALAALAREPKDAQLRSAFTEAMRAFVQVPMDWIALHAPEKAPGTEVPTVMKDVKKALQQVDFFLMPDSTVPADQELSRMRGRVRGQADKVKRGLDKVANELQQMIR